MAADNPFGLSPDEQAEYDRLAAEERGTLPEVPESAYGENAVPLEALKQGDAEAEAGYPVQHGAVRWPDAANSGVTHPEAKAVYRTPWGVREMSHGEVADLAAQPQPVVCYPVDADPETSLQQEKDEMSHVQLSDPDLDDAKN